jgi:simple sugar transport system permease protein
MSFKRREEEMTKDRIKAALKSFGLPRLIIAGFLLLLLIMAPFVGADLPTQISNIINRFSWNGILVLAMVPMVHSGCGLNFGLPLGIISGLLGATLSIEFGFTGPLSFLAAVVIATPFALILGALYGWLLNKIKGGEMMIATYVGFSSVSLMCMMWLILPYHSPNMVWGLSGKGLRTTISLEGYYIGALANIGQINIGAISIPTGNRVSIRWSTPTTGSRRLASIRCLASPTAATGTCSRPMPISRPNIASAPSTPGVLAEC